MYHSSPGGEEKVWGLLEEKGVGEEVEEDKGAINGDRRRLWMVNAQYNIQMMYYRNVHLKPIQFS